MRESAHSIDAAASQWTVRLDRGLTTAEQNALEAWLRVDDRRTGALARAQAAWVQVNRARVCQGGGEPQSADTWRRFSSWASAALVLLCVAGMFVGWKTYSRTHLVTGIGEIRTVLLTDGSQVALDTSSRVSVRYEPSVRLVTLESGAALFEVSKDPQRPFVVQAGNTRVRAVGTAFMVRRRSSSDVEVTVTHGIVDVWRETSAPEPAIRVSAGSRTFATSAQIAAPQALTEPQLAGAVAWRQGIIDLDGRSLGEAAAEFNRYNRQVIEIADPKLAAQTVVGRFHADDPTAFVNAASAMLDVKVRTDGDQLILEPRASRGK